MKRSFGTIWTVLSAVMVPLSEAEETQKRPYDDRGRDESDAATSPGAPGVRRCRGGKGPLIPRASAGAQPCPLCDFSLSLQSYEKIISVVLRHAFGGALFGQ